MGVRGARRRRAANTTRGAIPAYMSASVCCWRGDGGAALAFAEGWRGVLLWLFLGALVLLGIGLLGVAGRWFGFSGCHPLLPGGEVLEDFLGGAAGSGQG